MTSLKAPFRLLLLFSALGLTIGLAAGCQRVHVGDNDAGGSADAGMGSDGGNSIECGPVTCTGTQVCCNASCGICTEPDQGCIAIACVNDCASNADCGSSEYCGLSHCPDGTRDGTCIPRGAGDCTEEYAPVCGCDGATYGNDCGARTAGVVVARVGECEMPPPMCAAQDARGEGECAAILGVMWTGTACTLIGGCGCVGADCASIYDTTVQCEAARAGCHSCAAQDARGDGPCDAIVGTFWNGATCISESGCSCVGADCESGWFDGAACETAHRHCSAGSTCRSNSDCGSAEFCSTPVGVCGGPGTCEPTPGPIACDSPVCGCDGLTHPCAQEANSSRVSVAHVGECELACGADEVTGVGGCEVLLGFYWDGATCQALSGCECSGSGCARLASMAECERLHAGCSTPPPERTCGGFLGSVCGGDEWCDYSDDTGSSCGIADGLGVCRPRPMSCTFLLDPHCGCDGTTYDNECFANMAGQDTFPTATTCGDPTPTPAP